MSAEDVLAEALPTSLRPRADAVSELLRGVDLGKWGPCIDYGLLYQALDALDRLGDAERITPPLGMMFEAFRYGGPLDVKVAGIGQDPYSGQGEAMGICFSVARPRPAPESLKRIFGCLNRAGLRAADPTSCGDLRPWAVQGVWLMNAALTTRVGVRRAHATIWKPFVDELIRRFCEHTENEGRVVHFLLWGNDARAHASVARRHGHTVHEWTHPSPMADNKLPPASRFRECPHFEEVNAALVADGGLPIIWNNLAYVAGFTDGACHNNGKPGARASFAAVVTGGQFAGTLVRGEILPCEYKLVSETEPTAGIEATDTMIAPSHNRGEMMAIIYCLLVILRGKALGRVEIVSDSEICVRTLTEWLPARRRKGTEGELKNSDLVFIAERLLAELRKQASEVILTHTRSHQPALPASAPSRDRFIWAGNDRADAQATAVLRAGTPPTYAVEVLSGPAVVRTLASPGSG